MELLDRFREATDTHVRLKTLPIAVRFLDRGEDVPLSMGRPLRDLGMPIRPCKAWNMARHDELPVAMLTEDFATTCPASLFIFGLMEPVTPWLEGELAYGIYAGSREAAVNMERNIFKLEVGRYKGLLLAPITKSDFEPHLIITYCNSKQAMQFVTAAMWVDGEPLRFNMAARGLCSDGVVQPFQTGRPVLALPCGGDRAHGGTQDDELTFIAPLDKLEGIIEGLGAFTRSHRAPALGQISELRKKYNAMAQILDHELGR